MLHPDTADVIAATASHSPVCSPARTSMALAQAADGECLTKLFLLGATPRTISAVSCPTEPSTRPL